jgi:hypothetical protein
MYNLTRENILNWAKMLDVQVNKYWSNKKIKAICLEKLKKVGDV